MNFWQFCDFSLTKSFKTYLGPMLPPDDRHWQLIYPNFLHGLYYISKALMKIMDIFATEYNQGKKKENIKGTFTQM
jgi:hypothetical protein